MITAVIPARGGSKRVPMKNIRNLGGKPLIDWTISSALESSLITQILISTDDAAVVGNSTFLAESKTIFEKARTGTVYEVQPRLLIHKRSPSSSTDQALTISVIEEINSDFKELGDEIMLLQTTSPFRAPNEISALIEFKKATFSDSVFSVSQATSPHPLKTFIIDSKKNVEAKELIFEMLRTPEQYLPKLYFPDGAFYLSEKEALLRERRFVTEKSRCFVRDGYKTINIDSEQDLLFAQYILDKNLI